MERLIIENFLVIEYADIEIKRINVIIGEQSTGKSIIAKLVYLFHFFLFLESKISATHIYNQQSLKKDMLKKFENLFPRYAWRDQEFKIIYYFDTVRFTIERRKDLSGNLKSNFIYSENFKKFYNQIIRQAGKIAKNNNNIIDSKTYSEIINCVKNNIISSNFVRDSEKLVSTKIVFIPSSRTLFVKYFTNNIFAFLANNFDLEQLIINFGSDYENAQRLYRKINESEDLFDQKTKKEDKRLYDQIKEISEKILSGSYWREKDRDWLYHADGRKTQLIDASSGQQEALPMLLFLWVFPFYPPSAYTQFFIEEPETHLFPSAQRDMVELFTLLYANKSCNFFITTHSPYILTALNNKIMASTIDQSEAEKALGYKNCILYEDVAAYTIDNGRTRSIMNTEVNLIGINKLDAVSNELMQEFDELLEKQTEL